MRRFYAELALVIGLASLACGGRNGGGAGATAPAWSTAETSSTPGKPRPPESPACAATRTSVRLDEDTAFSLKLERVCVRGAHTAETFAAVEKALALQPGATLDPTALRLALEQVYATGIVDDIEAAAHRGDDGLVLVVFIHERARVKTLTIDGVKAMPKGSLDEAFRLKNDSRFDRARFQEGLTKIRQAYLAAGYEKVQIDTAIEPLKKNQINVKITIVEGEKRTR